MCVHADCLLEQFQPASRPADLKKELKVCNAISCIYHIHQRTNTVFVVVVVVVVVVV